jgi:hypothetical protein
MRLRQRAHNLLKEVEYEKMDEEINWSRYKKSAKI